MGFFSPCTIAFFVAKSLRYVPIEKCNSKNKSILRNILTASPRLIQNLLYNREHILKHANGL